MNYLFISASDKCSKTLHRIPAVYLAFGTAQIQRVGVLRVHFR